MAGHLKHSGVRDIGECDNCDEVLYKTESDAYNDAVSVGEESSEETDGGLSMEQQPRFEVYICPGGEGWHVRWL